MSGDICHRRKEGGRVHGGGGKKDLTTSDTSYLEPALQQRVYSHNTCSDPDDHAFVTKLELATQSGEEESAGWWLMSTPWQ